MLSISQPLSGSGPGNYYLDLAREDYYLAGGEPPGVWLGQGAEKLGLVGQVEREHLSALLSGFAPDGVMPLVQNAGKPERQGGWDLTFSAPKSVSVLWSQADEPERRKIQEAHAAAVGEAFDTLEEKAGFTRRGSGGKEREPVTWAAAAFEHGTSRALDPQLHTHVVLTNVGLRQDGTSGTLWSKPIFDHKMKAGKIYQEALAYQLQAALDVTLAWKATGKGRTFEVPGVPADLCAAFSKRRAEIEGALAARGATTAVAAKVAALDTRKVKESVARSELFAAWRKVGEAHGFTTERIRALILTTPTAPKAEAAPTKKPTRVTKPKKTKAWPKPARRQKRGKRSSARKAKVVAEKRLPFVRLQVVEERLFPKAPAWSPVSKWTAKSLRVQPDVGPWALFFAKKAGQGLLSIATTSAEALADVLDAWRAAKTQTASAIVVGRPEAAAPFAAEKAKVVMVEEARGARLASAFVLLDRDVLKSSPQEVQRLAARTHYFTDHETLRDHVDHAASQQRERVAQQDRDRLLREEEARKRREEQARRRKRNVLRMRP